MAPQQQPPGIPKNLGLAPPTRKPNIALSGVPGTGKTTLAHALCSALRCKRLDFGKEAAKRKCRLAYDEQLATWEINERKLVKRLAPEVSRGGYVLDWIHADPWASRNALVDLVITLRARTDVLHDRLKERGYGDEKIAQNMDAEIFGTILEENQLGFPKGCGTVVWELRGDEERDVKENVERVAEWVVRWSAGEDVSQEGVGADEGGFDGEADSDDSESDDDDDEEGDEMDDEEDDDEDDSDDDSEEDEGDDDEDSEEEADARTAKVEGSKQKAKTIGKKAG